MKFSESLKHIPIGGRVGPLLRTDFFYGCHICWKPTGWRRILNEELLGIPVCSDECLDAMVDRENDPDPFSILSSAPDLPGSTQNERETGKAEPSDQEGSSDR